MSYENLCKELNDNLRFPMNAPEFISEAEFIKILPELLPPSSATTTATNSQWTNENKAMVLILRYGLGGSSAGTLKEVGEYFGVTRNRIAQIQHNCERVLRHPSRLEKIVVANQSEELK